MFYSYEVAEKNDQIKELGAKLSSYIDKTDALESEVVRVGNIHSQPSMQISQ